MGRMRCVRREMPVSGLWAALVFLIALNLRPAIAAVGPLLTRIGADLNWGEGVQGILAAMPLWAFAAISPLVGLVTAGDRPIVRYRPVVGISAGVDRSRRVRHAGRTLRGMDGAVAAGAGVGRGAMRGCRIGRPCAFVMRLRGRRDAVRRHRACVRFRTGRRSGLDGRAIWGTLAGIHIVTDRRM